MTVPFDSIAATYDIDFTQSAIGKLQRNQVWNYLEKTLPGLAGNEVLELNCGTGDDAIKFAGLGFNVLATDISNNMLAVAQKKVHSQKQERVVLQNLDIANIEEHVFSKKFDLVFSNFGGLNCISPGDLQKLLKHTAFILKPRGRFIAVIMPKFCAWETLYFFLHFQFNKAFRRLTDKAVVANLHGSTVKTWYYSASQIEVWSAKNFTSIAKKPIGIAVPPSYLENFFLKHQNFLMRLNKLEQVLFNKSFLSSLADHYIIDMELK